MRIEDFVRSLDRIERKLDQIMQRAPRTANARRRQAAANGEGRSIISPSCALEMAQWHCPPVRGESPQSRRKRIASLARELELICRRRPSGKRRRLGGASAAVERAGKGQP